MSVIAKKTTNNQDQTQEYAHDFAKKLLPGDIICLYGDLGAGKTTFIQGLAQGLKIARRITSPTFIIMRSYNVHYQGISFFYHADLYRLNHESEVEGTGLFDVLCDKNAIVAIEWPERMGSFLPHTRYDITLRPLSENMREIVIEKK